MRAFALSRKNTACDSGFAMPMAIALGLCMLTLATTSILLAQEGRDAAIVKKGSASSLLISDSAIAEILTALSAKRNSVLLGKNFDPINPRTGTPYLGPDGIPNTNDDDDEPAINEWVAQTYACDTELGLEASNLSVANNPLGPNSNYQILAYRYNPDNQTGYLLVEGKYEENSSYVHISLDVVHDSTHFPGILVDSVLHWQGRDLTGRNANAYFNPTDDDYPVRLSHSGLSASASPTDEAVRQTYLDMVWSGSFDGFPTDPIEGDLIACDFSFDTVSLPAISRGIELFPIDMDQALSGSPGGTDFQTSYIDLEGTEVLSVDTTHGPVRLYVENATELRGNAKIENYRTDGRPPRVGDLRIVQTENEGGKPVQLEGQTCIENAFVYAPQVDVHLFTTGGGCPGPSDSNILGVVWAEDVENAVKHQSDFDAGPDWLLTLTELGDMDPGTSGIEVPDDVSSLVEELEAINFPVFYRISGVTAWNNVSL